MSEKNAGQPAADDKAGGEPVAKFFLPPARHEGVAEHTAGTYYLRVTGLTIRQIKEIFEDKFLGSMVWSNGAAYPTDGLEIRFTHPHPQAEVRVPDGYALVPVEPTHGMLIAGKEYGHLPNIWAAMLAAAPKPQDDLPAILKKQAS